jgi:hypothetical protein
MKAIIIGNYTILNFDDVIFSMKVKDNHFNHHRTDEIVIFESNLLIKLDPKVKIIQ